eukprot:Gb_34934 [translate_table: standard]
MDMSSAGAMAIDTKKKKKKRRRRSNSKAQGEEGTSQPTQESIEATKRKRREPTDRFCLSAQLHSQTENSKCTEDETQRGIRIEPAKSQQSASKPSSVLDKVRILVSIPKIKIDSLVTSSLFPSSHVASLSQIVA